MPFLRFVSSLLVIAATAGASSAVAQESGSDARARELYLRGDRFYAEGRYEAAVEAFQESYRLSGRPLLLFNLANAYERLGRYEEALAALRDYAPHAPVEEEDQIRARIENLSLRAEEQATADQQTDTRTDASTGDPDAGRTTPPPSGGDDTLIVAGAVLGGVGGALVIGGAVFGGLALDARGEAADGCVETGGSTFCDASVEDALDRDATYALLADIGLFGGAALAAAGIALIVVGATSGGADETARGGVTPTVALGPGGGEVGLVGSF